MVLTPTPSLLITGDGRHVALMTRQGEMAMLRSRSGDYVTDLLSENMGVERYVALLEEQERAECSRDFCVFDVIQGGYSWKILATRSSNFVSTMELASACKRVDIVISERWLPSSCRPRWFKADKPLLAQTGGLAFYLKEKKIVTVAETLGEQPWSPLGKLKSWKERQEAKSKMISQPSENQLKN